MVKSLNRQVDLSEDATWFRGISSYGKVMIGDQAFEFYNDRNVVDFVQIPWREVTYVVAIVHFHGKYIPRIELQTKSNSNFIFAIKEPKKALRTIRKYVPAENMRRALTLRQKLKNRFSRH
ncbi:MAG: DUF956 family protein [Lactobacillus sp.]|nr:DUF956 family protein [Lactobacillus sp.]MDN6052663.1 DUF956 family protein [Lactobacillus sp.]